MTDRDKRDEVPDVFEGGDNGTAVPTGVGTQQLVIDGWSASRADTGVAGPHLALGITNGKRAVVHVRQVPALVAALSEIAIRMTQEWERHGRSWLEEVGASAARVPEPEPAEERLRRRLAKAELMDVIVDRAPEVLAAVLAAPDEPAAAEAVAPILGISAEAARDVLTHLQFRELTVDKRHQLNVERDELQAALRNAGDGAGDGDGGPPS